MLPDSKPPTIRSLDRINLRLPDETFEAIEVKLARVQRAGVESHGVSNDA
jgi:hypothetical protein